MPDAIPAAAAAPVVPAAVVAGAAAAPVVPPVVAAAPVAAVVPAAPVAVAPVVQPIAPEVKPEPVKAPVVPLEVKIKVPEGAQYDPKAIGEFEKIFADEKLNPAQRAQAVIDLDHRMTQANVKAFKDRAEALRAADVTTLKADKEFGGAQYDASVASSKAAIKIWGGEELSTLLVAAGLDNAPAVVKTFARIKAGMKEDDTGSRVPGTQPAVEVKPPPMSQTRKIADALYNKKAKK